MSSKLASKVLLIDDHPAVRQGLALLLSQAGHQIVGEAGCQAEVAAFLDSGRADIAVLDLHLGPETGFDLIPVLSRHGIPVLVYSMFEDLPTVREVLECGAQGYVCKREVAGELVLAVGRILEGGRHVSPVAEQALSGEANGGADSNGQDLSDRERQILELLGQGYGNHEIADCLKLSVRTVESYCTRAIDKLSLDGMKALRRYAAQHHRLPKLTGSLNRQ